MSDWYARRVAQARGVQPPPAAPAPPPQYPQHPGHQPTPQIIGYTQDGQPIYSAPPQPTAHQAPPGYPQQPTHQQPPLPMNEQDFIKAAVDPSNPAVTPMDALNRAGMKGGRGTKTETEQCPNCGGNQYFQRRAMSKMGAAPAPYCHTCGYNGMYEQYGTQDVPVIDEA